LLTGVLIGPAAHASFCFNQVRTAASTQLLSVEQLVNLAIESARQGPIATQGHLTISQHRVQALLDRSNRTLKDALLSRARETGDSAATRLEGKIKEVQDELERTGASQGMPKTAGWLNGLSGWLSRSAQRRVEQVDHLQGRLADRESLRREVLAENEALSALAPALQRELQELRDRALLQIQLIDALQLRALDTNLRDRDRELIFQEILPAESKSLEALSMQVQLLELNETTIAQRMKANRLALDIASAQDSAVALSGHGAADASNGPARITDESLKRTADALAFKESEREDGATCVHPFLCAGATVLVYDFSGRAKSKRIRKVQPALQTLDVGAWSALRFHEAYVTHPGLRFRGVHPGILAHSTTGEQRVLGINPVGYVLVAKQGVWNHVRNKVSVELIDSLFFGTDRTGLGTYVTARYGLVVGGTVVVKGVSYRVVAFRAKDPAFLLEPLSISGTRIIVPASQFEPAG
jgi:hypothetical protein